MALALVAPCVRAAGLRVLTADDTPAAAQFVRQLRASAGVGERFVLERSDAPSGVSPRSGTGDGADEDPLAGVRTRGLRAAAAPDAPVTVAVGLAAAQSAIERPGHEALVLAMLSRLDYETLQSQPALRRAGRPVGVLLRDPALADQLALIAAVLPQKRRLGVVVATESEPMVRELQQAAGGFDLRVEYAPDASSLAAALRRLVASSDALLVLPDRIGDNQAATLAVLRAGATAGLPVFGTNEGLVRSGGLAAAVSTPAQLARQAVLLGQTLSASRGTSGADSLRVESALPVSVRVNANVARELDLRLPDEKTLAAQVIGAR
ncbi:MAG: ABC transporter substrate-binding protein [Gammaproteobacteria bacterium]|nr:ABC transporter substrate-binding protein [Gammaproteobacteria bacterium]MBU1442060.1 ABC transporter substrate-binding protein [Gammaproteobacteria bacterium]